jgi:hypothetical protein
MNHVQQEHEHEHVGHEHDMRQLRLRRIEDSVPSRTRTEEHAHREGRAARSPFWSNTQKEKYYSVSTTSL